MKYARMTVNLEATQVETLTALAAQSGLSASALARHAIAQFLRKRRISLAEMDNVLVQNGHASYAEVSR